MVTCATDGVVPDGMYCTIIVQLEPAAGGTKVPPGLMGVPTAQVPPVIEKAPGPAKVGAVVSVNEPAFAPVAVFLNVMVPVTAAVLGITGLNNAVGAEKPTIATVVMPVSPTV